MTGFGFVVDSLGAWFCVIGGCRVAGSSSHTRVFYRWSMAVGARQSMVSAGAGFLFPISEISIGKSSTYKATFSRLYGPHKISLLLGATRRIATVLLTVDLDSLLERNDYS